MEPTQQQPNQTANEQRYTIRRRGRFWEIVDEKEELVCITVYKRGACEVVRRLAA